MGFSNDIKHIIMGVDFSAYSKLAAKQAKTLAEELGVPLVYVHIYEDPIESGWSFGFGRDEVSDFYEKKIQSFYGAKDDITLVRRGKPHRELIKIGKKFSNSLLFVGHRGQTGIVSKVFLGSTAERLCLKSPFPVLVYRGKKPVVINKVLIPTDLSDRCARTLALLKNLKIKKLKMELFYVSTPPPPIFDYQDWNAFYGEVKAAQEKIIKDFKKKYSPLKVQVVMGNNVGFEIEKRAKLFDLIAITPHSGRGGMFAGLGSVSSKVVRSGDKPVLVLP